jgi:hypothetical protein
MIAQCRERGLTVTHGDVIAYLRTLPDATLGAVTGFHIIEHLPLETLIDLCAETQRVLLPGGIAIFESPNCKNLMVGACNFNVDPTHRNPVFPETAAFIFETYGFEQVRLEYLSPVDTTNVPGGDELPQAVATASLRSARLRGDRSQARSAMKLAVVIPWFGPRREGRGNSRRGKSQRVSRRRHAVDVLTTCCRSHQEIGRRTLPAGATTERRGSRSALRGGSARSRCVRCRVQRASADRGG